MCNITFASYGLYRIDHYIRLNNLYVYTATNTGVAVCCKFRHAFSCGRFLITYHCGTKYIEQLRAHFKFLHYKLVEYQLGSRCYFTCQRTCRMHIASFMKGFRAKHWKIDWSGLFLPSDFYIHFRYEPEMRTFPTVYGPILACERCSAQESPRGW